ncbi:MAG: helix-turn-helix transcriptional regulator [Rhodocyclaceae bacterium]|nr:helix-turn-helix transcriptional regulator [Rhodocyclaceae bacterium]
MATIGNRIKSERLRLKYSQDTFGDAAGVGKHSQIRYEKGERSPDGDYFAAIGALGADVLYIITGQRPLYVEQESPEYMLPARQLAGEIAAMTLTTEDAGLLLALARRIDSKKT